jgi:hypothetical protein
MTRCGTIARGVSRDDAEIGPHEKTTNDSSCRTSSRTRSSPKSVKETFVGSRVLDPAGTAYLSLRHELSRAASLDHPSIMVHPGGSISVGGHPATAVGRAKA